MTAPRSLLPCPNCNSRNVFCVPETNQTRWICTPCGCNWDSTKRAQPAEGVDDAAAALKELLDAIDARYVAETERKRANAISPRMEEAIAKARELLARSGAVDRAKEREALFNEVVDALTDIMRQIDCVDGTAQLLVDKQDALLAKLARARGGRG